MVWIKKITATPSIEEEVRPQLLVQQLQWTFDLGHLFLDWNPTINEKIWVML